MSRPVAPEHARTVVLVGPLAAGKSTLGGLVAARLGRPFVDVDEVSWTYGQEVGWTLERLLARDEAVGWLAAEAEWEPARAHAVERVLGDHPGAVVALGAGYTSFTDAAHGERVRAALGRAGHVVHVRPSPDPARCVAVLRERARRTRGRDWLIEGHDFIAGWVADPLPAEVATATVYTDGVDPEESAEAVVRLLAEPDLADVGQLP
ncbi:shikimate kinase [Promicromonospora thailandica]|uniref:Shikimate kinase n=1 Tax=Promicromonospora thailandica TaxID=765201 RepID=A0A9X2G7M8_9MICO|nr:shikimate kinase [Promicromonospora thailandica]MCP2264714.1 shikimate kinase [Promicromonospora thailandica]BFF20197.1 shikimate kinase AroK [Promicromonospora thailandica]